MPLYVCLVLCCLSSLLIYCIFGGWIITEVIRVSHHRRSLLSEFCFLQATNIADVAYATNWYEHPPSLRLVTFFIISRAQRSKYMQGLGMVNCSLESFKAVGLMHLSPSLFYVWMSMFNGRVNSVYFKVINFAASVLAVFQTISEPWTQPLRKKKKRITILYIRYLRVKQEAATNIKMLHLCQNSVVI